LGELFEKSSPKPLQKLSIWERGWVDTLNLNKLCFFFYLKRFLEGCGNPFSLKKVSRENSISAKKVFLTADRNTEIFRISLSVGN